MTATVAASFSEKEQNAIGRNNRNSAETFRSLTHRYVNRDFLPCSPKAFGRRSSYSQAASWNFFFPSLSGLPSSLSTCTHGSMYNSHTIYKMEFFFPLRVRSFNFLRFPSHWASKERCIASPSCALLSSPRGFCAGPWERTSRPGVRRDWYCIIDNRSTTDLKYRRWPCENRIVSINANAADSLWDDALAKSR